jgi:hypothetical protein
MNTTFLPAPPTILGNCLRPVAAASLAALLAVPAPAFAQRGMIGGMMAFGSCVESCMEADIKPSNGECQRYCECALTIEASRWQEELANSEVRQAACARQVFPHVFEGANDTGTGAATQEDAANGGATERQASPTQQGARRQ